MVKGFTLVKHALTGRFLQTFSATLISMFALTTSAHSAIIPLTLDDAMKRMMESSPDIKTAQLNLEDHQITYDIAWYTFWLPSLALNVESNYQYTIGTLPFTPARNDSNFFHRGPPSNTTTVGLGSFVVFDFFKQRAIYDKAKLALETAQQHYIKEVRDARISLINTYFETKIAQEKMEASEGSYKIAQAIAENVITKKKLGKATDDEVSSSTVDLNTAKIDLVEKRNVLAQYLINLNTYLNTATDTQYQLTTELPFRTVRLDDRELFDIYKKNSPAYLIDQNVLAQDEIDASIAEKNRLPLPTLSIQPLTIRYANGYAGGTSPDWVSGSSDSGTIDFAAKVTLSIPIFGPEGFFNHRTIRKEYIKRDKTEIKFHMDQLKNEIDIKQQVLDIRTIEQNLITQKETIVQNQELLNSYFKKAATAGVDRLNLRDAIREARESQFEYYDDLLKHLKAKFILAKLVGLDRLPGDSL
jgi:outer membrane protein TolC